MGILSAAAKAAAKAAKAAKVVKELPIAGLLADAPEAAKLSERTVLAPKNVDVSARYKTGVNAGNYRGTQAFGGITPQKATAQRNGYMAKMEAGVSGRKWYDLASDDIYRWTGERADLSDDMANMLATTSSRTPVASNLMYGNKGWNQHLVGDPIKTGGFPNNMGRDIEATLASPEAAATGLKRSPFSAGLSVRWRGPEFANRPTHDIHDVRAWGITDPKTGELWDRGVPDAGHRYLDTQSKLVTDKANETKLGGFDDWEQYRAQAAAWIAQKAETDGTPMNAAARQYGDFGRDYQAMLPREWTTGKNTGHLQEMHTGPAANVNEYSDAMESIMRGKQGIDRLASDSGALVDRTTSNQGFYEGAESPGYITNLNVGKETGKQSMDPASRKVAEALASAHGLLGTQKQVAGNYVGGEVPMNRAGAARFPSEASPSEMERLFGNLDDIGAWAGMREPGGGTRIVYGGEPKERQAIAAAMRPPKWAPPGMYESPTFHAQDGLMIPERPLEQWSSKPFIEKIDAAGAYGPKLSEAMQPIAGELLNTVNAQAAKHGWTQAPWFKPMMEGIRDGGIPRLKELVKQGIVPVAAMTAIGLTQGEGETD